MVDATEIGDPMKVQCAGSTSSGERCRRMVPVDVAHAEEPAYCHQHAPNPDVPARQGAPALYLALAAIGALVLTVLVLAQNTGPGEVDRPIAATGVYAETVPDVRAEPLEPAELPPAHPPVEAVPSDPAPGVVAAGVLHEPEYGSAERTALMEAARVALNTTSQFEVLQLLSDGAWAIGELKPAGSSSSWIVAWRNESALGWAAFWTGAPDSAAREQILLADGRMSPGVVDAFGQGASSGSSSGAANASEEDQLKSDIVATLLAEEGASLAPARVTYFTWSTAANGWWAVGSFDGPVDGGFFIAMPGRRYPIELFVEGSSGFFEYLPAEIPYPVAEEIRAAGGDIWLP